MQDKSRSNSAGVPWLVWFLGFGFLDLLIAVIAAYALRASGPIMVVLLPTLTLWGDDPATPRGTAAIFAGLMIFGGSFLLYGVAGVLVGLLVRLGDRAGSKRVR